MAGGYGPAVHVEFSSDLQPAGEWTKARVVYVSTCTPCPLLTLGDCIERIWFAIIVQRSLCFCSHHRSMLPLRAAKSWIMCWWFLPQQLQLWSWNSAHSWPVKSPFMQSRKEHQFGSELTRVLMRWTGLSAKTLKSMLVELDFQTLSGELWSWNSACG